MKAIELKSMNDLAVLAKEVGSLSEAVIHFEMSQSELSYDVIWNKMKSCLDVMKKSVETGLQGVKSTSRLSGMDANTYFTYINDNKSILGSLMSNAVCGAIATNEVNAAMGLICATPTAGSAGVLPGVLSSMINEYSLSEEKQIRFLFVAAGVGYVIANNSSISGAEGGCQAEIGSASAMTSAAVVDALGGSVDMAFNACAMTIKNMLGLICDPVAGLVEVPCVKRNALGATQALVSADLALAGVKSRIPVDEVIDTMYRVGQEMDTKFKETAKGGLARTKTAVKIQNDLFE